MKSDTNQSLEEAIGVLQQLGLKEYEARCFVGLSRMESGTAKQLSEITEVPRTRVYDAIRVLEAQGLVEVHHSSPQQFRAVPLEEATETLRDQYETRVSRLQDALETVNVVDMDDESQVQEIWSMAGRDPIEHRSIDLIDSAEEEIVLVLGDEVLLTSELVDALEGVGTDVSLIIGGINKSQTEHIQTAIPEATTFISGLEWLHGAGSEADETAIGRLQLIDRSTILVSSIMPRSGEEQAIFGGGFGNGLIVIARRLMAEGLLTGNDPGH